MIVLVKAMKKAEVPDDKTFDAMIEFLRSDSMFAVPFIRINASYWASFAVKVAAGQKTPPNRGAANDAEIVSTLLPYCDAMFLDNHTRSLITDVPKNRQLPYGTRLFSPSSGDQFLAFLDEIINCVPKDHLDLVRDVYGI